MVIFQNGDREVHDEPGVGESHVSWEAGDGLFGQDAAARSPDIV